MVEKHVLPNWVGNHRNRFLDVLAQGQVYQWAVFIPCSESATATYVVKLGSSVPRLSLDPLISVENAKVRGPKSQGSSPREW